MADLPSWEILIDWAAAGQDQLERAAMQLTSAQVAGPSRLPGWSRGHLLSHLARNADALTNLLTWARTGVETRMYSTPDERDAGILAGAGRGLSEQLADLTASGARFLAAAREMPADRWSFQVLSAQGRKIAASEVPWLRVREVWVHLADLDAGYDIDTVPDAIAWALTKDVAASLSPRTKALVDLRVIGYGTIRLGSLPAEGDGVIEASVIEGGAQQFAGWLTGRSGPAGLTATGEIPDLPPWL
jgi:maleylpyruvate isomerase